MDLLTQIIIFISIGVFAGFMSGIFGIGGGSVRIPLLNFAGLNLINAYGINLAVIPISSFVGSLTHKKNIDFDKVRYVIVGGLIGSLLGALLTEIFSPLILAVIFFIISIITIIGIYFDKIFPKISEKLANSPNIRINLIGGTFILNLITGMRGGSGGSLFPSFLKMNGLDIHKAIATSLFATIFTASTAVFIYWYRGNIDLLPAFLVIIGSMIGVRIGSNMSLKAKPFWLEVGLSVLVIFLSLLTVFKAIF